MSGEGQDLRQQLQEALERCARLTEENARLRAQPGLFDPTTPLEPEQGVPEPHNIVGRLGSHVTNSSQPEAKVALFRALFRGRQDVFPVRWETKKGGRSGYSPACVLEWRRPLCRKPMVKCGDCRSRRFRPVTDEAILDHLKGKHTMGCYPLLPDETCWFIAVDFDKGSWQEDASAFMGTCKEMGIPAALERSRSGQGGHVWIFFDGPIQASVARRLGSALLTRTMEGRPELGLDSYDRLIPSQDTLPKGGFGGLVALPLQKGPREEGNSVFVDERFVPYPDQWAFLSGLRRMETRQVERIVEEASRAGGILGVRVSLADDRAEEEDPWAIPLPTRRRQRPVPGPLPGSVRVLCADMLYIEKEGLPPALLDRILRLAAFQNPEFYKTQAMRMPTFGVPRVIGCGEDRPRHLALPRGCLEELTALLRDHGIRVEETDGRFPGIPIPARFHGELRPDQEKAAQALLAHELGILCGSTAFGKTVVAIRMIAARGVNTLVLVHRRQLLDQWRERLSLFLDVPPEAIGQIGGGKSHRTQFVDVAVLQGLNRKGQVKELVAEYGHVIVDECHHVPAFSFEQVLKRVRARYVLGLTATPIRKDGHHPIIVMQCGPIRFRESPGRAATARPFQHLVIPRETSFRMPWGGVRPEINRVYAAIASDARRNEMILEDLLKALEDGRSPLVLTERTDHLDHLAQRLTGFASNVLVLKGGMGKRQRAEVAEAIKRIPDSEERVILATGRYIGEGFDDPRLDTLFLAMPISWRGTLQQYVGRLHRLHQGKHLVQVYDYVDIHVPILARMYQRRLKGYEAMGYSIKGP
jgi:superfamily II DNA or RNA helicase